jgi:hypothetical protein
MCLCGVSGSRVGLQFASTIAPLLFVLTCSALNLLGTFLCGQLIFMFAVLYALCGNVVLWLELGRIDSVASVNLLPSTSIVDSMQVLSQVYVSLPMIYTD